MKKNNSKVSTIFQDINGVLNNLPIRINTRNATEVTQFPLDKIIQKINYIRKEQYGRYDRDEMVKVIYNALNSGINPYPLMCSDLTMDNVPKLIEKFREVDVDLEVYNVIFDHNLGMDYEESVSILNFIQNSTDAEVDMFIELIKKEEKGEQYFSFGRAIKLVKSYKIMTKTYLGKMKMDTIYDLCRKIDKIPEVNYFLDEGYSKIAINIIYYAMSVGMLKNQIKDIMNDINFDDSKNSCHELYFSIRCILLECNPKWKTIDLKYVYDRFENNKYSYRLDNLYPTYDGTIDFPYFLRQISSDNVWDNINHILETVRPFPRDFGTYQYSFAAEDATHYYNERLLTHRNIDNFYSIELLKAFGELNENQKNQVMAGLDENLDIRKYTDINNSPKTMKMVRDNLRLIKVAKLSGLVIGVE